MESIVERSENEEHNENVNKSNTLLLLLQMNDSSFPTGAFTHSLGYESSVQRLHVTDKTSLEFFVVALLENVGSSSVPYVKDSYQHSKDISWLCSLDQHYATTHSNHVANHSSKQQGRSFLHASCQTFDIPLLEELQDMVKNEKMIGFQEIIFGAVYAFLGVPMNDTLNCFLFSTLRTVVASVVRLGRILGTMEAQAFQYKIQKIIPSIGQRNLERTTDEVCLKYPIVDLMQCSHDTLFSRLFYS